MVANISRRCNGRTSAMTYINGLGHFHPENIIDNAFLRDIDIGTDGDCIMDRVGIERRRTVLPLDYIKTTRNAHPRHAPEASTYTNDPTAYRAPHQANADALNNHHTEPKKTVGGKR